MFANFDPALFDDLSFKEDSVREVVILPILSRLGYHPSGNQCVVRSKVLEFPFIYVGTRRHPVKVVPDYTLTFDGRPVLILDAKSPSEDLGAPANLQQAYSYAIHPEIRTEHFALCNGRRLVLYSINDRLPLLDVQFSEIEDKWAEIERYLKPAHLLQPSLRKFTPDFGTAVPRMGFTKDSRMYLFGVRFGLFVKVDEGLYTASVNTELAGKDYCVSYDFSPEKLPQLVAGLPAELASVFIEALSRFPFQAAADLAIEADLQAHLGELTQGAYETFVPLVIDKVIRSRFNMDPPGPGRDDIPSNVFRLSNAFKVV